MADTAVKGPLAFTASNGTTLEAYDSDFSLINGSTGYTGITSNKLTFLFADNSTDFLYRDGVGTYTADQYASAVLSFPSGAAAEIMLACRVSADTGAGRDAYLLRYSDGSGVVTVERWNNGTKTTLDTRSPGWASGDTIKLRAVTNGANCDLIVVRNGTVSYTISDTSPLASGKPGFALRMSSGGIVTIDDLELGNVTASAPVLSAPTATATGNTTATVGFTTDQAVSVSLPAYFLTLPAATAAPASAAALIADGATVSQTTGSTTPTRALTGLTAGTALRTHMCQPGSNVVSSASFTPNTLASSGSLSAQTGTAGGSITWAGVTPDSLVTNHGNGSGAWSIVSSAGFTVAPSINTSTGVLSGGTLSIAGTYAPQIRYTDSSTVPSAQQINHTLSLTVSAAPDTTAPTLSSPAATGGTLTCSGSVSTNEGNGTLYTVFCASATPPSAVQVEAGQDSTGAAALRAVSQAVSATGSQVVASGSITAGTRYAYFMHKDAAGNRSTVAAAASIVVSASGTAPSITVQPSSQTVTAGGSATFNVTATGSGLTYQWRKNGTNISGATSSSYTTPATVLGDSGAVFSVVVTGDTSPAATSSGATLTVNAAPSGSLPIMLGVTLDGELVILS